MRAGGEQTISEELTQRITTMGDEASAQQRDDIATELFEVERALSGAARRLLKLAEQATAKNLKVGVGLMSRHAKPLQELHDRISAQRCPSGRYYSPRSLHEDDGIEEICSRKAIRR